MKKQNFNTALIILSVLCIASSCKKSSDDSSNANPSDPCSGVTSVVASGIAAPVGDTIQLFATTVTGASYLWSGPNGFTSSKQNPTIPAVTSAMNGAYKVKATVNSCVKESSVSLATFTFSTPPCSPASGTYTMDALTYHQIITDITTGGSASLVDIYAQAAPNQSINLTFNINDVNSYQVPKDGVYKIKNGTTATSGYVVLKADLDQYEAKSGFICVKNYVDVNFVKHVQFVWCDIKVKNINGTDEKTTSGYAINTY